MVVVRWFVFAFALLLLAAALPPLLGAPGGATSAAPAYAWFHLAAAVAALLSVALQKGAGTPWFALVFGLADLYQALASALRWFPVEQFQWTPTDDLYHLVLGAVLVAAGVFGFIFPRKAS